MTFGILQNDKKKINNDHIYAKFRNYLIILNVTINSHILLKRYSLFSHSLFITHDLCFESQFLTTDNGTFCSSEISKYH